MSVIAQPSINKAKRNSKKQKEKEILESTKNLEVSSNKESRVKLPSVELEEKKVKTNNPNKQITIMEGQSKYDICKDISTRFANITLPQLLDVSPKLRADIVKALKLKTTETIKETPEEVVLSAIRREDVATVECLINGVQGIAFLDTGASINIITRQFLNKLGDVKPIGFVKNNIVQLLSKENVNTEIYLLKVQLGDLAIHDIFRVIDNHQNLFDVLISYKTLKENNLFINPINNNLCIMKENNKWMCVKNLCKEEKGNVISDDEDAESIIIYDKTNSDINNNSYLYCFVNEIDNINDNLTITQNKIEDSKTITKEVDIINENGVFEKDQLLQNILKGIPKKLRNEVKKLFDEYNTILATKIDELKPTKLLPHSIQLEPNAKPIKQRCYRLSKVQALALKKELEKLIKNKLIEPSHSPWSSPVILVPKKNKQWRICIDFRKLNNLTIKDAYSLPLIDEILFSIGKKVKVFTTIDLFSGFHQIPMNKEDIPKTSFATMYGNYQFLVMPFGLCNAPGTFQREMNRIFFPLIGVCMFVYIDDLVIFSPSFEQHIIDIKKVFDIIKENGLKINLEKCHFFKIKVELLGHTLSINGISPIQAKVQVILEWIPPKNVTQLQSFLGAVGYYRKFILNFANIAKPLFKLVKKGVKFVWGKEQEESFNELKLKLASAPILVMPDFEKQFIIRTDASFDGIGGVLLQKDENGIEKPIHFVSRSLKPAEKNYSITDLEGTAATYCVQKFKSYISGNKNETLLFTDHKPLVGLFKNKETNNSRQTRWVLLLSMLKVKVLYEPGKKNVIADALSRLSTKENTILTTVTEEINENNPYNLLTKFKDKFTIINNEEYYKDHGKLRKVIKNQNEKIDLILKAHKVGHEGVFKTYNRLKRDYYWINMILDVKYIVRTCDRCQHFRSQSFNNQTEDIATQPGLPFTKVGLDIVGSLPTSRKGNKYIIVLVDYLTKWVEAEPTQNIDSDDVIEFLSKIFARFGIPEILVTDNGPQFCSDKTKAFLDLYGVYVNFVVTYHPESNGQVENRNKEIGKYLRLLCNKNTSIWDEMLPSALWALRTCKNETTKFSSFELLYGRRDLQPFELQLNLDKKENYESDDEFLIRRFTKHYKWIKEAINNIQTANKIWEDRRKQVKRLKANYKPGDLVLIKYINRRKLDPYFLGPMKIVKKQFNTVTLCDPLTNEIAERNVHLKNIIPYRLCEIETSRDEV